MKTKDISKVIVKQAIERALNPRARVDFAVQLFRALEADPFWDPYHLSEGYNKHYADLLIKTAKKAIR